MKTTRSMNALIPFALLLFLFSTASQAQIDYGGGAVEIPVPEHPCISPQLETEIHQLLATNRALLVDQGILQENPAQREGSVQLEWPLQQAFGFDQPSYYTTVNYVDLDPTGGIKDYQCNGRSYNGHNGMDMSLWPFWWQMMDDNQVEIIAAAPGVILAKHDNYFDKNCTCIGTWNAVYVEHSDGSVAWYGHMKKNTLTNKLVGASVETGDYLGLVGSSGCSSNPHLHFELRDMNSTVIDPYEGPCNNTTPSSWWATQKPYQEPSINRLTTHAVAPQFNGFCPSNEIPNLENQFYPGQPIHFTSWYRDQLLNAPASFVVKDPLGTTIFSWNQQSPGSYIFSYWYWSYLLPANAVEGIWSFEATFNGEMRTHYFQVGDVTSVHALEDEQLNIYPNPVTSDLVIQRTGNHELAYTLVNLQGQPILVGTLNTATSRIDMGALVASMYVLQIKDPISGKSVSVPVVKAR